MYTAQDLEVLVVTHKRPALLKETLDCFLSQSVKGFRLAVFSNGHSPETKQLLQTYAAQGVEDFYTDEELTSAQNWSRAIAAARGKLLVLAHDDDLIHPQYIENLLALFNRWPRLTLAISGCDEFRPALLQVPAFHRARHFTSAKEFAAFIYSGGNFAYPSSCYQTDFIKKAPPVLSDRFGKVCDVPFMIHACSDGEAAVTEFPFIQYRIHDGQDSHNYATGPTAREWINLMLFYKEMLGISPRLRWVFRLQNYRHLRLGWRDWTKCEYNRMSFNDFKQLALEQGALTRGNIWLGRLLRGKISHWLQQKILGIYPEKY